MKRICPLYYVQDSKIFINMQILCDKMPSVCLIVIEGLFWEFFESWERGIMCMPENTIYDRVLKTEAHDRKQLAIPLVNEIYREQYQGQEEIEFLEGEHYIRNAEGYIEKRTTDCYFKVKSTYEQKYHIEVQSTPDTSMVQRIYEYDSAIAYEYRNMSGARLTVKFPRSAVVFLRHTKNTPDSLEIVVEMEEGSIIQKIPVMKLQNYTLDEILEKNLLILIPFHIFVYENKFMVYNKDERQLEELIQVYKRIVLHLNMLVESGAIEGYDRYLIASMTVKVVEHLAKDYDKLVEGVKKVMDGGFIDYPGRESYLAGREAGRYEGRNEGALNVYISLLKDGIITLGEVAKRLDISEEKVKSYL